MKSPLLILMALGALGAASAAEPKPITVAVGQEFNIALEANPSTGYQWVLATPLNPKLLTRCGREYKRPNPRQAGASGSEVLTFRALSEGKAEIKLKYGKVWEGVAGSARNTNFVVLIQKEAPKQAK